MQPLVIVGAGGFGREVTALVEAINDNHPAWELLGFVDDHPDLRGSTVLDWPVLGSVDWLCRQARLHYVLALGTSRIRYRLGERLAEAALQPATLLHPEARYHRSCHIGPGAVLCQGVTLTVGVTLGRHVILNLHATAGHEAVLGDYTTAHPGVHISGAAVTGVGVELGTGCVLLPGVQVGRQAIVGAGAVVHRDLPEGCTAVGVPARPLPPG
jgi:sugar O-acyltransferase (sialic acid O-acetyltransferase NeuD family)